MCKFISWIENPNDNSDIVWLDDDNLDTSIGRDLLQYLTDCPSDIVGHGAIVWYYQSVKNWVHRECEDFSTPDNFPPDIVTKIKQGKFSQFGVCPAILTPTALAEFQKIEAAAWEEYEKIEAAAWEEYEKIEAAAMAEYEKIEGIARADFQKIETDVLKEIEKPARAELQKLRITAWQKFQNIKTPAWEDYENIKNPAWEEYGKIVTTAKADFKKIVNSSFWKIARENKNRVNIWK